MDKNYNFGVKALIILQLLFMLVYGERTKDKMYEKIMGTNGCYRRLNATHQIGCSSKRGGSTGVIHYCESLDDLNFMLDNGTAPPYIPVLPTKHFTIETIDKLITSQKVSGLVLHRNNDEVLQYFTHENQCPNPRTSLEGTCEKNSIWNPHGTGLLYADIPFPVFYIESEEEIAKMRTCFEKFNNFSYDGHADRSLCSLELKSFMYATTNTETCRRTMRRDNNIWATLYPLVKVLNKNETELLRDYKYIVIAARMDTTSMFERTSGANSPVTGIVTLLYTAKLLKSILKEADIENGKKNVLFVLFNGETYDYIGSQRLLYDMQRGDFPVKGLGDNNDILPIIRPEDIGLFIELSQLGNSKDENNLFVHYLKDNAEVIKFYHKLSSNNGSTVLHNLPTSLPPASLHTFLRNNSQFPGMVLSDHEKSYTNNFYNSIFDNATNINFHYYNATESGNATSIPKNSIQQFIANISEVIARSVYEEITHKKYQEDLAVDVILVDELFHCYLQDPNCKVHSATQKGKLSSTPASLYVGVDHIVNFATTLTALTLGWFTGDPQGEANINCTNKPRNYAFRYYNMSKSIYELNVTLCYKITMNTTEAVSPAFIIPDYDWSSGLYSSWAESTWADMGVKIFLKPSSAHEKMTVAIGCISVIFSFVLVYFMKSRSHILFTPPLHTEAPTDC
ncbi:hypothetical protein NQ314_003160 [Rhamnusium bicolor]|uniref:Nicastrin n=1 Tax=Rhamnusium bicolor TaxID=1586634 RepID=A0AAV8ZMI0_9CUCU|nr:hypothetical protein NQ314_003160 [Rhamnusium bicolor]